MNVQGSALFSQTATSGGVRCRLKFLSIFSVPALSLHVTRSLRIKSSLILVYALVKAVSTKCYSSLKTHCESSWIVTVISCSNLFSAMSIHSHRLWHARCTRFRWPYYSKDCVNIDNWSHISDMTTNPSPAGYLKNWFPAFPMGQRDTQCRCLLYPIASETVEQRLAQKCPVSCISFCLIPIGKKISGCMGQVCFHHWNATMCHCLRTLT